MLKEAAVSPNQVPPEYGGTLEGFDSAWFLRQEVEAMAQARSLENPIQDSTNDDDDGDDDGGGGGSGRGAAAEGGVSPTLSS
eukprot:CAMPEP_0114345400 /NCGR_PEP_ID=MMETSP0101-20121206/12195_1 /TAXON_ID=38822 ORGANISM="Pteridomonas danica, Strain PT" /NCGR_SAMPLE_ID=MMETSP0101 /ASSEMBLY_ACC=CAM_ASM_000211 /LENGTH=81 /DNA_ID=CAMNT_0001481337 /DNA_START=659 /DNA_END=904 /DNA_ORIENTATION=-